MSWMSDHTVGDLTAKRATLIKAAQEYDDAVEQARKNLLEAEQQLSMCKDLAEGVRKQIAETDVLLAIAQGRAPLPTRADIRVTDDGLGLALGALHIAMAPDGATAEQLHEFAETMRALYAAAGTLAHRADESAKAAARGSHPWTDDVVNDDGSTTVKVKRACNGCGQLLGDLTDEEVEAAVDGRPLPDVRGECPRCSGTAQPVAGQPPVPAASSPAGATVTDREVAQP